MSKELKTNTEELNLQNPQFTISRSWTDDEIEANFSPVIKRTVFFQHDSFFFEFSSGDKVQGWSTIRDGCSWSTTQLIRQTSADCLFSRELYLLTSSPNPTIVPFLVRQNNWRTWYNFWRPLGNYYWNPHPKPGRSPSWLGWQSPPFDTLSQWSCDGQV